MQPMPRSGIVGSILNWRSTRKLDMKQTDEDQVKLWDEQFYINGYNLDVDQLVGNELTLEPAYEGSLQ